MSSITKPFEFSAGDTILASEHNLNFNTIYNDYNGNITNVNVAAGASIAASKLNLSTIAQAMTISNDVTMSGAEVLLAQGTDEASATTITLDGDGNFYDITGTTNIETITAKQAGTVVWLRFNGSLTLVDNTGNLELYGADITVQTEDFVCLVSDGTNWNYAGGTKSKDFSLPSQAQGDILYFNGTNWTRLAAGTSGQLLKTNGAAANPSWGGSLVLTSTTPVSGTNSGDITIAADKFYRILFNLEGQAAAAQMYMRFNNDSATNYQYTSYIADINAGAAETAAGGSSKDGIYFSESADMDQAVHGELFLSTHINSGKAEDRAFVHGNLFYTDTSGNAAAVVRIRGWWGKNEAISNFELVSSQSVSGNVDLYEYAT